MLFVMLWGLILSTLVLGLKVENNDAADLIVMTEESVNSLEIAHNLVATRITFPNLEYITDGLLTAYDNPRLQELLFPMLKQVDNGLLITGNKDVAVVSEGLRVSLPSLKATTGKTTFRYISAVNIKNLTKIQGNLVFESTFLHDLSVPNLRSISGTHAGTITVLSNSMLQNITVPQLESMTGSLIIAKNKQWTGFQENDFGSLSSISGSLVVIDNGPLESMALPSLKLVEGAFQVRATEVVTAQNTKTSDCSDLNEQWKSSGRVKGRFSCQLGASIYDDDATTLKITTLIFLIALLFIYA